METQKLIKTDIATSGLIKENRQAIIFETLKILLILLWICTATGKLTNLKAFSQELHHQNFSQEFANILLWFIPISEITAAIFLVFAKTRQAGLLLSNFLLFIFTGYIGLVIMGYYEHVPCSCAGIFKHMGWQMHFWFNISLLLMSLWTSTYYYRRFRRKQ